MLRSISNGNLSRFEAHPAPAGWMQATTVLQIIPARMKIPISSRKMTPVTATVRNTASADSNCMARLVCDGDHLPDTSEMVAQLSNIAQFCDDLAFVIAGRRSAQNAADRRCGVDCFPPSLCDCISSIDRPEKPWARRKRHSPAGPSCKTFSRHLCMR